MTIRQYIQVKAPALPDPATYCPAFGYDLPVDPNVLEPDPTWYPTGDPVPEEIILTCSDTGDCRIAFYVSIESAGSYVVNVYGVGGILINTQTKTNNTTYSWQFPMGGGVAGIGQTTFKVSIKPASSGKHILGFKCNSYPNGNVQNWQILHAKFNTPGITTLSSAFASIDALQGIEFYSSLNTLALCDSMCYNCSSLKSIAFPNLPALTSLSQTFYGCSLLTSCVFGGGLPLCSTMANTFYQCVSLPSLVFPSDLPGMLTMQSVLYGCIALKSVAMPLTMDKITIMSNAFYYCNAISYIKMPDSLPLLEQLQAAFSSCKSLTKIDFCSSSPRLINCMNMCYGSPMLKSFTFPATLNYLTNLSYSFGWCYSLKTLTLPLNAPEVTTMLQMCCNCYILTACTLPAALTKVTTVYQAFQNCYEMTTCIYPPTMDACLTLYATHFNNKMLTSITFPTSMNAVTTAAQCLQGAIALTTCVMPASMNAVTNLNAFLSSCNALVSCTPPLSLPVIADISSFINNSYLLAYFGPITFPATQVNAGGIITDRLISSFNYPTLRCSALSINGSPLIGNLVTSINIDWANSLWGFNANPISFNYLNLSATELNRIFTALPTVTGKTINVQNCTGSATCTPVIATAKGWIVLR